MKFLKAVVFFLFGAAVLTACSYHDLELFGKNTDRYNIIFMLYPTGVTLPSQEGNIVILEYNKSREVVKRIGGVTPANYFTGFDYVFSPDIYDAITYENNVVTIQRKDNSDNSDMNYRKQIFTRKNQISRMVVASGARLVITYPTYDASGLIAKTIETTWWLASGEYHYISHTIKYFFYVAGNLTRVEGQIFDTFNNKTTTLEKFGGYDTAPNPNRNLGIFDELFYRSLSRNNFKEYSFTFRNSNGIVTSKRQSTWEFAYDNEGVPVFY